jgi:tetratricopeptide (TPR) repeat protein
MATQAPIESIERTLDQAEEADARQPTSPTFPKGRRAVWLAIARSDLATADSATLAMTTSTADSSSEADHANRDEVRIAIAEETGDSSKALAIAESFVKQVAAWTADDPLGIRMERVYLLHQAGALSDGAFAAARNQLFDEHFKLYPSKSAAEAQRRRWLAELELLTSPSEATSALSSSQDLALSAKEFPYSFFLGNALVLSGRFDEAVPVLQNAARVCYAGETGITGVKAIEMLQLRRVHLILGRALEGSGRTEDACREYGVVQTLWRGAKPRSVTLEAARARSTALRCPH